MGDCAALAWTLLQNLTRSHQFRELMAAPKCGKSPPLSSFLSQHRRASIRWRPLAFSEPLLDSLERRQVLHGDQCHSKTFKQRAKRHPTELPHRDFCKQF